MKIDWESLAIIFLAVIVAHMIGRALFKPSIQVNITTDTGPAAETPRINSLEDYIRVHYPGALS